MGSEDKYISLFEVEGISKDSQILNLILVSLFSADTLLSVHDCERSSI